MRRHDAYDLLREAKDRISELSDWYEKVRRAGAHLTGDEIVENYFVDMVYAIHFLGTELEKFIEANEDMLTEHLDIALKTNMDYILECY